MIILGDVLETLRGMESESVNCIVTSPPYWGLRDYGHENQLGLEKTPQEFIAKMTEVFRECRRVLRKDGTCWVNTGDSYATGAGAVGDCPGGGKQGENWKGQTTSPNRMKLPGLKPKDLCGIPWRLALSLQDDGWYLRSDIIWAKPNPMPESVTDRPTKSHEYIFLLTKSAKYWYDADAIKEYALPFRGVVLDNRESGTGKARGINGQADRQGNFEPIDGTRNARTVWTIATQPYKEAHFATFPEELPKRCILAGCPEGGTVLDPFAGSGTTIAVAIQLGRKGIGIELNPEYAALARKRISGVTPGMVFI
jgi:DNA modification methylase